MFLNKIRNKDSGILLYGITPPKSHTPPEKLKEIAQKTIDALSSIDIDALIVYDVQDESARTTEERPFPFSSALDPFLYVSRYLQALPLEKIIYRAAGKFTRNELSEWLNDLAKHRCHPVLVGLPSPDYVVKTTLDEAYAIWREGHAHQSAIGAVTIPERHAILRDEDVRILAKVDAGVTHFISQCIFDVACTVATLEALLISCKKVNQAPPTIIFTLTICGSPKTLSFMEWLGIQIPTDIKQELTSCENPIERSVEIATAIAAYLIQYCHERSIPFGFNIEAVAVRKEEVNASLELLSIVRGLLQANGLRTKATMEILK